MIIDYFSKFLFDHSIHQIDLIQVIKFLKLIILGLNQDFLFYAYKFDLFEVHPLVFYDYFFIAYNRNAALQH